MPTSPCSSSASTSRRLPPPMSGGHSHSHSHSHHNPSSPTSTTTPGSSDHVQTVVKHIHLPPLPPISPLSFEIILSFHALMFYGLQLLHLYRTVWWLPQSFNTGGGGVHLHLISPQLAAIIFTVLTRRVIYLSICKLFPRGEKFLVPVLAVGMLALITFNAMRIEHLTWVRVVYLLGPIPLHVYTYGRSVRALFCPPDYEPVLSPETATHHTCTTIPAAIRTDVEMLINTFNRRIKSVFFQSFMTVYYSCFVPWGFCKPTIHYDLSFVSQHLLFSSLFTFTLISSRSFCPDITDRLHKVALHLGSWIKVQGSIGLQQAHQWSPTTPYPPSTLVVTQVSRKHLYRSISTTPTTTADPLNASHARFHTLFSSSTFTRLLLGFHLSIELLMLIILFRTYEWYQVISVTALLVTSTPTLIRLGRDFLVVWKLYKAEEYLLIVGG